MSFDDGWVILIGVASNLRGTYSLWSHGDRKKNKSAIIKVWISWVVAASFVIVFVPDGG